MKGEKRLNDFKFVTFIDRFKSDSAASMAVKGLSGHKHAAASVVTGQCRRAFKPFLIFLMPYGPWLVLVVINNFSNNL